MTVQFLINYYKYIREGEAILLITLGFSKNLCNPDLNISLDFSNSLSKTICSFTCLMKMEPEVREFLQKIVWSLSATLLWLLTNTLAGLKFEYAIFNNAHVTGNIIFYCWFFLSFYALYRLLKTLWNNHL